MLECAKEEGSKRIITAIEDYNCKRKAMANAAGQLT